MTEAKMQELLMSIFEDMKDDLSIEFGEKHGLKCIRTFEDASLLTRDKGVLIRLADGCEFQLTITKSRDGSCDEEDED